MIHLARRQQRPTAAFVRGAGIAAAVLFAVVLTPMTATVGAQASGLVGARAAHEAAVAPRSVAEATAVKLDNAADRATLTFDLSASVEPSAFVLADPDRVILDLPQVDFLVDSPAAKATPTRGRGRARVAGRGKRVDLVASYRFGLLAPGRSRVVIDLGQPARIVDASVHKAGTKLKLVVELAKTDRASFRASLHSRALAAALPVAPPPPTPAAGKATIVLDPGHGGPDNGAMVNGNIEKDITLAFAKALAAKLEAEGGFNVVMTRASDVFIPLSERVRIARGANAALMISIHADTLPESADVSGATVYTVSDKASDAYAAKVAAKENDADAAGGVDGQTDTADVNDILFDLTRQETRAYSHVFARTLVNYWKVAGRLNKNPQRAAGFVVLKAPDVPSVLLELGYLSSPVDAASLSSDEWRQKASARMAEAITAYFADRHGPAKAAAGIAIPLPRQASADLSLAR